MIGRSLLDVVGEDRQERAQLCVVMAGQVKPDDLDEVHAAMWEPGWLMNTVEVIARAAEGEPEVLEDAIRFVRDQLERGETVRDGGSRPPLSWAQALVVLNRAAARGPG